jgi:hypothetical protein
MRPVSGAGVFPACGTPRGRKAQVPDLRAVTSLPVMSVISPPSPWATSSLSG